MHPLHHGRKRRDWDCQNWLGEDSCVSVAPVTTHSRPAAFRKERVGSNWSDSCPSARARLSDPSCLQRIRQTVWIEVSTAVVLCDISSLRNCKQVSNSCRFSLHPLRSTAVYGGAGVAEQIADLKRGTHIVVATPGRLIDILTMHSGKILSLQRVTYVVMDEAGK